MTPDVPHEDGLLDGESVYPIVLRRAVFLDRDGTIIVNKHYLKDPQQIELMPDAISTIRAFNEADVAVIVVTNQSGIARGLLTESDFLAQCARLDRLLGDQGASVDAWYHCPHHPDFTGPCDCRKPGTALFERAITENFLDPSQLVFVGDRLHDLLPAMLFSGRGILVPSADTTPDEAARAESQGFERADSLRDVSTRVLGRSPREAR